MKQKDFYNTSAWKYCSRYVLLYYSVDGVVQCSTSPELSYRLPNKNIQCGHYFKSDAHKSLAFEFKNLAPQSYRDNKYFSGKPEIMKNWIEKTHGKGTLKYLEIKKNAAYKLDKSELDFWREYYKKLFNELVKIKGNPWK